MKTLFTRGLSLTIGLTLAASIASAAVVIQQNSDGSGGIVGLPGSVGNAVSHVGGAATPGSNGAGGAGNLTGGAGDGSGNGGAAALTGGAAGATGTGGAVNITSGAGGSTSGNSGNINLTPGAVTSGSRGNVVLPAGNGSGSYHPAGVVNFGTNLTSTGTGADTTEDILQTFTLPANTFDQVGRAVRVTCYGTTGATANNKTMKLYFGASVITTPTAATNNKNWWLDLVVTKTGSSTQFALGRGQVDTTMVTPMFNAGSDTDTGAITIKCTGTNGTAAANDVVAKQMIVEILN